MHWTTAESVTPPPGHVFCVPLEGPSQHLLPLSTTQTFPKRLPPSVNNSTSSGNSKKHKPFSQCSFLSYRLARFLHSIFRLLVRDAAKGGHQILSAVDLKQLQKYLFFHQQHKQHFHFFEREILLLVVICHWNCIRVSDNFSILF